MDDITTTLLPKSPFSYQGVIFDFDGTIADSMDVWHWVDNEFLARRGIKTPADYGHKLSELGFDRAAIYSIKRFGLEDSPEDIKDEWNELALERYATSVFLKPGARSYIENLVDASLAKTAIATTLTPDLLTAALENNGISNLFDACVTGHEVEHDKNEPDIYRLAARRINVACTDCLVYEDIACGVASAQRIGMTAIGVRDDSGHQDFHVVRSIADGVIDGFDSLLTLA